MPNVVVQLHSFLSDDDATKVADEIRQAGEVKYVDATGAEVSVSIGDVTVQP